MPCDSLRSNVCDLVRRTIAPTALGNLRRTIGIANDGVDDGDDDYCQCYFPPKMPTPLPCGGEPKKWASCFGWLGRFFTICIDDAIL